MARQLIPQIAATDSNAVNGTEEKWVKHYRELEKPLYSVVFRWLWDATQSQDIVQEAFLRCWQQRKRIKPEGFKAFVYKTALNLARNERRRRRLWQLVPLATVHVEANREDAVEFLQKSIRDAIDALSEKHKRVLLLCEVAGLSYKEVASVVGVKEGTVGSRRNRGLLLVRQHLQAAGVQWDEDGSK